MNLVAIVIVSLFLVMPPACLAHPFGHEAGPDVGVTYTVDCHDVSAGDDVSYAPCSSACCCGDFIPSCHFFHAAAYQLRHRLFPQGIFMTEVPPEIFVPPEFSA